MTIIEYASKFIGKPYIWGGTGTIGFDCSGLVIECLQAFGDLPKGDWTADTLATKLQQLGWIVVKEYQEEDVVFFRNSNGRYYHTAIMINDHQFIEAGGGDSKCTTAANSTGIVRLRTLAWNKPSLILRKKDMVKE